MHNFINKQLHNSKVMYGNPHTKLIRAPKNAAEDHFIRKRWAFSCAFLVCTKLRRLGVCTHCNLGSRQTF